MRVTRHPVTGLHALGYRRNGAPIWPVLGGSEPLGAPAPAPGPVFVAPTPAPPSSPPPVPGQAPPGHPSPATPLEGGDRGYPPDVPLAQMTDAQQAAYWRFHSRRHEATATGRADYDQVKAELERLRTATQTDSEKAIEAARLAGVAEAAPRVVSAYLRGALTGRVAPDVLPQLVDSVNPAYFLTAKGEIDDVKVTAYVAQVAPAQAATATAQWPDMGQGTRTPVAASRAAAGAAEADKRFGKKPTPA